VPQRTQLTCYLSVVIAGGCAAYAWSFTHAVPPPWGGSGLAITLLLVLGVFAGEWMPAAIWRRDRYRLFTFSGPFTLALIILGPLWIALLALTVALAADEARSRRPLLKVAFNVSQYALSVTGARFVYATLTGQGLGDHASGLVSSQVAPSIVAAAVFFLINSTLVAAVLALAHDEPLLPSVATHISAEFSTSTMLLCTGPVIVIALHFSMLTAPLCLLPIAAVRQAVRTAATSDVQAKHDALTGLPNRAFLLQRAERVVQMAREKDQTALLLLDLDHFKEINDTLGHQVGDELLRLVAERLVSVVRDGDRDADMVARLGGDEFAVLCPGLPDVALAEVLSQRFVDALGEPFALDQISLHVEASVGIALLPLHAGDVDQLVQRADVALYQAKAERGTTRTYDPEHDFNSVERLALMEDLRAGMETQLVLHYQPKCRAGDGSLVGVEALVRWEHPRLGLLQPESFIPAAENTGLVVPMTMHILRESLQQVSRWRAEGLELNVAVNISPRHLAAVDLPDQIGQLLAGEGLPGSALTLEVTESSIMSDPERAAQVLRRIRALDISVSIDDFGTGHSSLVYLRDLSATEVKIDKTFVQNAATSPRDAAIVKAAVDLGHGLELQVVAEGVEDLGTVTLMATSGCDLVQGNVILPPVTAAELSSWSRRPQVLGRGLHLQLAQHREAAQQ